jgi:uncharacterized protein YciI
VITIVGIFEPSVKQISSPQGKAGSAYPFHHEPLEWKDRCVSEWVFFMHPPRDDFMATMTGAERSSFDAHAAWLRKLLAEGVLILAGPCLGQVNTGIAIFEAPSEQDARRIVADEPVTSVGYMRGELRPYRLGLLRGRDHSRRRQPLGSLGRAPLPASGASRRLDLPRSPGSGGHGGHARLFGGGLNQLPRCGGPGLSGSNGGGWMPLSAISTTSQTN